MLRRIFERQAEKRRIQRSILADSLVRRLDEKQELIVDRTLLSQLGATRRDLFRVAYSLAIREKLYILAGRDGLVRLMTNEWFRNETHNAAFVPPGKADESLPVTDLDSEVLSPDTVPFEPFAPEETLVPRDPVPEPAPATRITRRRERREEAIPLPLSQESVQADDWSEDWSGFVVKERREVPGTSRKSLPPRGRDPWTAFAAEDIPEVETLKKK